jgi:hypothetical protein
MGFGELVLILIIVVVVFGATKLPEAGLGDAIERLRRQQLRPAPPRPILRRRSVRGWTFSDWLVVCAAIAAAGAAALLAFVAPPR